MGRRFGLIATIAGIFASGGGMGGGIDWKRTPNISANGNYEYRNPMFHGRSQRKKKSNGIHRSRMLRMKHRKNK